MILIASFLTPSRENRKIPLRGSGTLIGREEDAGIRLEHPSVSREHAYLSVVEGKSHFIIEDRDSANGTWVEGVRVKGRSVLYPDQNLEVGPFRFRLCLMPPSAGSLERDEDQERVIQEAVRSLPDQMTGPAGKMDDGGAAFAREAERILYRRIVELMPSHTSAGAVERLTKKALTISLGLGPIEEWLQDPEITEIMINGTESVYIERSGRMHRLPSPFPDEGSVMRVVDRILLPLGRRVDEKQPYADGRLPDGSRINVIIPPVSLSGAVLTIRKFSEEKLDMDRLVEMKSLSPEAARLLETAVKRKRNVLISGGTGTGKTTLLNSLAAYISPSERVVTIEDAAELNLDQEHVVRLETRTSNIEGEGEVTTRDLVRNALRMRPDRIIVGECRGGEALDMLQAMNTGHEGSMTTCHANSPRDALKRLEVMVLMAGMDLPLVAIREQIASAIDIVVQIVRAADGRRCVSSIEEVDGIESDQLLTQSIFRLDAGSGALKSTNIHPSFLSRGAPGPHLNQPPEEAAK